MDTLIKKNTFLLLLQLKDKTKNNKRLVLLKQFLKQKGSSSVIIINDVAFPLSHDYCALIIVETNTKEALESYIEDYKNDFKIQIQPVSALNINTTITSFNYCLFIGRDPLQKNIDQLYNLDIDNIEQYVKVDFSDHKKFLSLYLVHATSAKAVLSFGKQVTNNRHLHLKDAMAMQLFFEMKLMANVNASIPDNSLCNAATSSKTKTSISVLNEDDIQAFYSDSYFNAKNAVEPHQSFSSDSKITYVFQKKLGVFYFRNTDHERDYKIGSKFPMPNLSIPQITEGSVSFNLTKSNEVSIETGLSKWLHDLLHTKKYNLDWPEDHYVGEEAAVYTYILSKIAGNKKPKDNTVRANTVNSINMPSGDQPFSEKTFLEVKTHLATVCTSFEYLNDWYADNGHFDILIREIAVVSGFNLKAITGEMSIDASASIETTLDSVFAVLTSIIGVIPIIGPGFAGAIKAGWVVAKNGNAFGDTKEPIQAVASEMADKLSNSLLGLIDSSAIIYKNIAQDWGKLKAFADDAQARNYLPKHAFGTEFLTEDTLNLPSAFIEAGTNAWDIIFYQALFGVKHTVDCGMDYTYDGPSCKLEELDGKFNYTLPAQWYDVSMNVMTGHIVLACSTDAPKKVLNALFGPDGLGVDPIAFFLGFNGWPKVEPHLFIDFDLIKVG